MQAMNNLKYNSKRQRGGALIIVLLLTATLSFIVLSLVQQTAMIANRTDLSNFHHDAKWRAVGVEALAVAVIEQAYALGEERLSPESSLFSASQFAPLENGQAEVRFSDKTVCFNLNSLVRRGGDQQFVQNGDTRAEFVELATLLGLSRGVSENLAAVIIDWIDDDRQVEAGGAEDNFYTALPAPYRTGRTLLADVSELRAMSGVTAEIYRALLPWLCAHPTEEPARINVNFLTVADAPLLAAMTEGAVSVSDVVRIIETRPAAGFDSVDTFWSAVTVNSDVNLEKIQSRIVLNLVIH